MQPFEPQLSRPENIIPSRFVTQKLNINEKDAKIVYIVLVAEIVYIVLWFYLRAFHEIIVEVDPFMLKALSFKPLIM